MNLEPITPYKIIEFLKKQNEELKKENEELKEQLEKESADGTLD